MEDRLKPCPWKSIRTGDVERAISDLQRVYEKDPDASHAMELGAAYLWIEDYHAARRHFLEATRAQDVVVDSFYEMSGAASWCLGEPCDAVAQWAEGLSCGWTDWAGGVTLPLLLFFASVLRPEVFAQTEAQGLLSVRSTSALACAWPGALGKFVLGLCGLDEVEQSYKEMTTGDVVVCGWQTQFYVGLLKYMNGNTSGYLELMRATAATTDDDFDSTRPEFLGKVWHAEFFLARYEAKRLS